MTSSIAIPTFVLQSAEMRLEITLYFLASIAEYRTIGNLFGVSKAFVCLCVKEVCYAITNIEIINNTREGIVIFFSGKKRERGDWGQISVPDAGPSANWLN